MNSGDAYFRLLYETGVIFWFFCWGPIRVDTSSLCSSCLNANASFALLHVSSTLNCFSNFMRFAWHSRSGGVADVDAIAAMVTDGMADVDAAPINAAFALTNWPVANAVPTLLVESNLMRTYTIGNG